MSDSIYHMTLKILKNCIFFCVKMSRFSFISSKVIKNVITFPENLLTTCGLLILLHGVLSLPDGKPCDKMSYDLNPTFS